MLLAAACGKGDGKAAGDNKPVADPAAAQKLAERLKKNDPVPGAGRACQPEDYANVLTLTYPSVVKLSGESKVPRDTHENADWVNPYDLDAPAVRTLLDAAATNKGEAAAEFLAAQAYLVYRVDLVDVGLAVAFKDMKRGMVAARAIKYDRNAKLVCTSNFTFRNTHKVSEWAMDEVEKTSAAVPQIVVDKLREDLRVRYLRRLIKLGMPLPTPPTTPAAPGSGDEE